MPITRALSDLLPVVDDPKLLAQTVASRNWVEVIAYSGWPARADTRRRLWDAATGVTRRFYYR